MRQISTIKSAECVAKVVLLHLEFHEHFWLELSDSPPHIYRLYALDLTLYYFVMLRLIKSWKKRR